MISSKIRTPDHDFVPEIRIVAWEEPEEKLSCLIPIAGHWKKTSIALSHIPSDVWKSAAVDSKS